MEHLVALAFLNRLSDFEKDDSIRTKLKGAIMQGRTGSEICRIWHIKPEPIAERDSDEMQRLLIIWRKKRDSAHLAHSTIEVCECSGELDDIASWLNFVNREFPWPENLQTPTWTIEPIARAPRCDPYFESPQLLPHDPQKFLRGECECQTCIAQVGIPRDQEKRKIDENKLRQRLKSGGLT